MNRRLAQLVRSTVSIALLSFGATGSLHAQVLVSVFAGGMHTAAAKITVVQPALNTALTFPRVPFRGESFDSPIYYGYRIAVRMPGTRAFYVEGEVIHGKIYAQRADAQPGVGTYRSATVTGVPFASVFDEFAMSHGLNFFLANVVFRRPLVGTERWIVTTRVGAGPIIPHREIQIEGHRDEGYQIAGAGAQVSGGVEWKAWNNLSVLAEYKFTLARAHVSVYEGTARLTTRSQHLVSGIGMRF